MTYTLVATAKNEAPYLLEWVAYHRMIGFDDILIYQNDSDDYTDETLKIMDRIGAVRYFYNRAAAGRHQVRAYRRAARQPEYRDARWAMALDLDEFLHIRTGEGRLDDLLTTLPDTDVVLVNWRRFGNDGHRHIGKDLVTETFLSAEPAERIETHLTPYKALFRPSLYERCGIHRPQGAQVDEDSVLVCNGSGLRRGAFEELRFRCKDPGRRRLAQINHYITRDAASFVLKSNRGSAHQANRGIGEHYWAKRNFNDQKDYGLARRSSATMAAMAELDAQSDGELGRLRLRAIGLHQDRFERLMGVPEYRALYAYCAETQNAA